MNSSTLTKRRYACLLSVLCCTMFGFAQILSEGLNLNTFGSVPYIETQSSIFFDGQDDYIDIENHLDFNDTGFTLSAWIKRDATDSGTKSILSKRDNAFTNGYDFRISHNNNLEIIWKNDITESLTSSTTIPNNEWHHVAVVYHRDKVTLYIDGVVDSSAIKKPPIATEESFYIGAAGTDETTQHFKGNIDEVRIWNTALSEAQLRFMMNQEITNNDGQVAGKVLPITISKNDIDTISWSSLAGYYPMSKFRYIITEDASENEIHGTLRNIDAIDRQTAPLPYLSNQDGYWDTHETWLNGALQSIPGATSIVDPNVTIDWNIVRTEHDITMENTMLPTGSFDTRKLLGLYVDANTLTLAGDNLSHSGNALMVSHYLYLEGKIDLEGESQVIQDLGSDLDVAISGVLEKDQQGTADKYTYDYWSSPVGKTDIAHNNYRYAVRDIMYDGDTPVNFSTSGFDGAATSPIRIADYWIWKYANQINNSYSSWQHIRRTGVVFAGEGFTMKGPGTGDIGTSQNYVFKGKPNNGDINLILHANNDYLVGNPYPSAIDANKFILDNGPQYDANGTVLETEALISGTLYFWQHWGGGSHILSEYQGGYATYNFSGGLTAASYGTDNANLTTGGLPTKLPGRYIPVGQGFFVIGNSTGLINFNNGQRVFKKGQLLNAEDTYSEDNLAAQINYQLEESDQRMKFRIGFHSANTIRRQLLLTIDANASPNVDWAFDAKMNESQMDDMFWVINNAPYIIQGSNQADVSTTYPIGIKLNSDGLNTITIDHLKHVPNDLDIYIHDIALDYYHNLRDSDYSIFLNAGEYLDRFEMTFSNTNALSVDDIAHNQLEMIYANDSNSLVVVNPNLVPISSIQLFNILGQSVHIINNNLEANYSKHKVKNLSSGTYIVKAYTDEGSVVTNKVLVR